MKKILTVPAPMPDTGPVYVAGNHHVSVPHIDTAGRILALSHLRESVHGLIEYKGEPLVSLRLNGSELAAQRHSYENGFIPTFICDAQGASVTWRIFAPEHVRGVVIMLDVTAGQAGQYALDMQLQAGEFLRSVFHSYPLGADVKCGFNEWTGVAVMELVNGGGLSAVAAGGSAGYTAGVGQEPNTLWASHSLALQAGESRRAAFYLSVGAECDGACLANVDMRRRENSLYSTYLATLQKRYVALSGDGVLERRANLNLNFCYYFSIGYALDTGRLMLATSKSSRYYVAGAYWARDCFLWAFPSWLRANPKLAREALLQGCTLYLKEGAHHAVYLNGVGLYPGFELDELVAPIIALERYCRVTGDKDILALPEIKTAADFTLQTLARWQDETSGLYATELSPSDDPVQAPYLIYNNYLVLAALRFIGGWQPAVNQQAEKLAAALEKYAPLPGGEILAWATDAKSQWEEYDNPPGSLLLIPYYGGLAQQDALYQNTLKHYFSKENPHFYQQGDILGQGCEHAPAPWPMSLCNQLLVRGKDEALLRALRAMPMDNGVACETVRVQDGMLHTGAAFATAAGFYANAILEAYGH